MDSVRYVWIFCLCLHASLADVGYDIFFSSNTKELSDYPLVFDKPLPKWLKGTMIRNGLGRFEVGDRKFLNALDAFGKLSSWKFTGNGNATFSTKMIYSKSYNESLAANDIAPYLMLDRVDPPFDIVKELESFRNGPDNTNVNIFDFGTSGKDFVVVSDYWNVYKVDPHSLDTLEFISPPIPNTSSFDSAIVLSSAHALPEPGTSNSLTFVSVAPPLPGMKGKLIFVRAKSAHDREVIATIEVDKVSYMHSFAVTENYAILFAVPFYVDPVGMLKDFRPLDAFEWVDTDITNLYVINLKTGDVTTLKTENVFFLHVVNAYESELFKDQIIVDICTFKDTGGLHQMELAKLHDPLKRKKSAEATLKRYTLDLQSKEVNVYSFEPKSKIPYVNELDFPTINENFRSKTYCYAYGIVYNYDGNDFLHMALVKKDVCSGTNETSFTSPNFYLNEAFFVPNPDGVSEDDGVLILPVLDLQTKTTNITILDAKDLSIVTSAQLPTNLPFELNCTKEDMENFQVPGRERTYCAYRYIELQRCWRNNNYAKRLLLGACKHDIHNWHQCLYDDRVIRRKEYEREKRLLARQKRRIAAGLEEDPALAQADAEAM